MTDAAPKELPHEKADGWKSRTFWKSAGVTAAVFVGSCVALGFDKITGNQWMELAKFILGSPAIYGAVNVMQRRQSALGSKRA